MKKEHTTKILLILLLVGMLAGMSASFAIAQDETTSNEFPSYLFGGATQEDLCKSEQDFFVMIEPGSCEPAVVRSDLLEEQNVPVFCKLIGLKINPLIQVPYIDKIIPVGFKSTDQITGINFYPARKYASGEIGFNTSGAPGFENLGWLVVNLKKQPIESKMPQNVNLNLSTKIYYDYQKSFGVFDTEKALPIFENEDDFENNIQDYAFWGGKGFVRAFNVQADKAEIGVYSGTTGTNRNLVFRRTLNLGQETEPIYIGSFCSGGVKLKLDDITYPKPKAYLYVDGNEVVVTEGKTLIAGSGCKVEKITSKFFQQYVRINCGGKQYELGKDAFAIELEVNGIKGNYTVGSNVSSNVYLAYFGVDDKQIYAIAMNTKNIVDVEKRFIDIDRAVERLKTAKKTIDETNLKAELKTKWNNLFFIPANQEVTVAGTKIKISKVTIRDTILPENIADNYDRAKLAFKTIVDDYTYSKGEIDGTNQFYGFVALQKAIDLAYLLGKTGDAEELTIQLRETYQGYVSDYQLNAAVQKAEQGNVFNLNDASAYINDSKARRNYFVVLQKIDVPDENDINTTLEITKPDGVTTRETYTLGNVLFADWYIKSDGIKEDSITIEKSDGTIRAKTIKKGEKLPVANSTDPKTNKTFGVKVVDTALKREAFVSITPASNNGVTTANFSVQIGIEKRAIQLTTDQINARIAEADKQVQALENFNKGLGSFIENMKTACIITQGVLWTESMFRNLFNSGEVMARNLAMNGFEGFEGYNAICKAKVEEARKGGVWTLTMDRCLAENEGNINTLMGSLQSNIGSINKELAGKKITELPGVLDGKIGAVGQTGTINDALGLTGDKAIPKGPDPTKESYDFFELLAKQGKFDATTTKNIELSLSLLQDPKIDDGLKKEIKSQLTDIISNYKTSYISVSQAEEKARKLTGMNSKDWKLFGKNPSKEAEINAKDALKKQELISAANSRLSAALNKIPAAIVEMDGKDFAMFTYEYKSKDEKGIEQTINHLVFAEVYNIKESKLSSNEYNLVKDGSITADPAIPENAKTELRNKNPTIVSAVSECSYPFSKAALQQIRLFDATSARGLPAVVPFTVDNMGYYVLMNATYYDMSSRPNTIQVFNVGGNGKIENGENDDCSFGSQPVTRLESISANQKIWSTARKCLDAAIKAARSGQKSINCDGVIRGFGSPYIETPKVQCQNFMSPTECSIMFNVCDPVICPPSRCNFGGRWQVANPISSGLIGSFVLCSPNWIVTGGDVVIPVCLSGIYASLQNIEKTIGLYKSCLQEQLTSGKVVGICDEIQSVYWCELIWRETLPLIQTGGLNDLIGSLFNIIVPGSKQSKTGGEYLTFDAALKNVGDTFSYMFNYQSQNIMQAFKIKSMAQIGTEICKMAYSVAYPNQADLLKQLTKPESPPQFWAKFDEIPYTTVTVPPSSQYSVSYQIYSGENQGVSYRVYLSEPPTAQTLGTDYVAPYVMIDSGYLTAGNAVNQKIDKLLPSGYQKLCVQINTEEYCGFKQVTSDFGISELNDLYLQNQLNQTITNSQDCLSGTSGLYAAVLANPNLEEAVSETLNPNIYARGINRICYRGNPGAGSDEARWSRVGWCNQTAQLGCWLDRNSATGAITDLALEQQALQDAASVEKALLSEQRGKQYPPEKSQSELDSLKKKFENLKNGIKEDTVTQPETTLSENTFSVGFDFSSYALSDSAKKSIKGSLGKIDLSTIDKIKIEGWASVEGLKGFDNTGLSKDRADAVKNYILTLKPELPELKDKITATGKGTTSDFSGKDKVKQLQQFLCDQGFIDTAYSSKIDCKDTTKASKIDGIIGDYTKIAIQLWQTSDWYQNSANEAKKKELLALLSDDRVAVISFVKLTSESKTTTQKVTDEDSIPEFITLAGEFDTLRDNTAELDIKTQAQLYSGRCYEEKIRIEYKLAKAAGTIVAPTAIPEKQITPLGNTGGTEGINAGGTQAAIDLKLKSPYMSGNNVKELQKMLCNGGFYNKPNLYSIYTVIESKSPNPSNLYVIAFKGFESKFNASFLALNNKATSAIPNQQSNWVEGKWPPCTEGVQDSVVDGVYGPLTAAAVIKWQEEKKVVVNGIFSAAQYQQVFATAAPSKQKLIIPQDCKAYWTDKDGNIISKASVGDDIMLVVAGYNCKSEYYNLTIRRFLKIKEFLKIPFDKNTHLLQVSWKPTKAQTLLTFFADNKNEKESLQSDYLNVTTICYKIAEPECLTNVGKCWYNHAFSFFASPCQICPTSCEAHSLNPITGKIEGAKFSTEKDCKQNNCKLNCIWEAGKCKTPTSTPVTTETTTPAVQTCDKLTKSADCSKRIDCEWSGGKCQAYAVNLDPFKNSFLTPYKNCVESSSMSCACNFNYQNVMSIFKLDNREYEIEIASSGTTLMISLVKIEGLVRKTIYSETIDKSLVSYYDLKGNRFFAQKIILSQLSQSDKIWMDADGKFIELLNPDVLEIPIQKCQTRGICFVPLPTQLLARC